jgi:signal transduction histidine kinase
MGDDWPAMTRFQGAVLAGCLVLSGSSAFAQPRVQQILLLQGADRGNLVLDSFTGDFRVDLDERTGRTVNVIQIVVGPTGFAGASDRAAVDYIRATFADRPRPDLILTVSGPAATFARRHRQELFPDTPLVLAAVDRRFLGEAPLRENEIAVGVSNDFPRHVEDILQVLPRTRQVLVVTGSGPLGRYWRPVLEGQFQRFKGRLTFIWSDNLSLPEILRRCAALPPDSAIFYISFGADALGGAYADERVLSDLRAVANAPLFASHSPLLGHGIVGGSLLPIHELSRITAGVAAQILNGASPASIGAPSPPPLQPMFDWRELRRWGIAESRLPPGSTVLYRSPTLWQEHKLAVIASLVALALQSLLIAGLLYQRRARRQAERDSRRHLSLAADASRRLTVTALTNSIAHDLGQPLSSTIQNAEALRMMIDAGRAPAETVKEILADIQAQSVQAAQIVERHRAMLRSHDLQKKPIDLHGVVRESLALVAHDLRTRDIEATADLSPEPCFVSGDAVLLQQVLVNLLMNAMDAMAETPKFRRSLSITTAVRGAELDLSVRDAGTGLPPQFEETLFKPFVTTKTHGLGIGLTIVRAILDEHGATIAAHGNPEGGATLTVTFRRSTMPERSAAATDAA